METLATSPLTMAQRLKFDLARIAIMTFRTEQQELAATRVREYVRVGMECIRHYSIDGFDHERKAFWQEIDRLRR